MSRRGLWVARVPSRVYLEGDHLTQNLQAISDTVCMGMMAVRKFSCHCPRKSRQRTYPKKLYVQVNLRKLTTERITRENETKGRITREVKPVHQYQLRKRDECVGKPSSPTSDSQDKKKVLEVICSLFI